MTSVAVSVGVTSFFISLSGFFGRFPNWNAMLSFVGTLISPIHYSMLQKNKNQLNIVIRSLKIFRNSPSLTNERLQEAWNTACFWCDR